ncbi:hypothetical protein KC19_N045000 [Ceratodon purpureus]|nr:hypothetical protein KC19_N045000 [Ceratodon purpureus]
MAELSNSDHVGRHEDTVETVAPRAPVTSERFVSPHLLESIPSPNVPQSIGGRGRRAPAWHSRLPDPGYSVLQQHCQFFDLNNDGIIYPWETYIGFRAIGFNILISFLSMVIINGTFSYIPWIPGFHHSCFQFISRTSTRTSGVTPNRTTPRAGFVPKV